VLLFPPFPCFYIRLNPKNLSASPPIFKLFLGFSQGLLSRSGRYQAIFFGPPASFPTPTFLPVIPGPCPSLAFDGHNARIAFSPPLCIFCFSTFCPALELASDPLFPQWYLLLLRTNSPFLTTRIRTAQPERMGHFTVLSP